MSVTIPWDALESATVSERLGDLRLDAWELCAEFVQRIVTEAQVAATRNGIDDLPDIDWAPIWQAGEGAATEELAIGRIVRAASETAREISLRAAGHSSVEHRDRSDETIVRESLPLGSPPAEDDVSGDALTVVPPLVAPPVRAAVAPAKTASDSVQTLPDTEVSDPIPVTIPLPLIADDVETAPSAAPEASAHEFERVAAVSRAGTHSTWFSVFTWIRNVGVVLLLFVGWQLWGTSIAQHQAQDQLKSEFDAALRSHHVAKPSASKMTLISAATRVPPPAEGSVIAELRIPAIGVDQYVVEGTNTADLSKGPGHYTGTAMPGQAGNVAIAGHRTTHGAPFNGLGHVAQGDKIILTTTWGEVLTYVAFGMPQAVSPSDVGVLNYFNDNRITLTTCNPEFSSSQRLIVMGKLITPPGTKTAPAKHLSYHVVDPGTASWNWSMLPAVGIIVCLLLLLALSYRRFAGWFGGLGKWLILLPIWAAGLYLLFSTLTNFLPGTY